MSCAARPSRACRSCWRGCRRSIWSIVEGYKAAPIPSSKLHRAAVGKPLLHPDDDCIVAVASDVPLPKVELPVVSLDDIEKIADVLTVESEPLEARAEAGSGVMAQLSDDCFAFDGPLLPIAEAERLIAERIAPVAEVETVPLAAARGRVIARDVRAPIDLPPFDNSAVDGYAVRHADLAADGDTRLTIVDRVTAGRAATRALKPGEAIRIFTGAPMPAGADTVFMQEDTREEGGAVIVPPGLKRGANSRVAGEDLRAGTVMFPAGRRLTASHVALAAAVGLTALPVRRRVRVAVFSTGDEIVEPGQALPPAALFDANRYLLAGLIERLGASFTDLGILPDDKARLSRAIADAAAGHDLVLTSGGVSTGEADHVKGAVEAIGKLVFWRVGIKPGRPVAMGVVAGARAARARPSSACPAIRWRCS